MVKAKRFIFAKHFEGEPKLDDFKLVEEELPALKDGEILCKSEWLSVDPYMRPYTVRLPTGITMIGSQVATIVESKNPKFPVGKLIVSNYGWRSHAVINPVEEAAKAFNTSNYIVDFGNLSSSYGIGALGMPGNTAYFGLLEICKPKAGEVVVVSGAAGAVGSLVGQIAKIKGCTVIGYAGSDDKVDWLKKELGFDFAFNYKKVDISESLKQAAPKGVDCYFDNVGGKFSTAVLSKMNTRGRVSVCGAISMYNDDPNAVTQAPCVQPTLVFKELMMEGFIVHRWASQWQDGVKQLMAWMKEGKLKTKESVTEGFENMPKAFIGMLKGENTGKAVVKA